MRNPLLYLLLLFTTLTTAQYAPRLDFGAKFEVPDRVIHGMGQSDELSLAQYAAALPPEVFPQLFMAYIPARADAARLERSMHMLRDMVRYYPEGMGFQIGISMTSGGTSYAQDVADGVYDEQIDRIARSLDSLGRDIFIRVGYEANGFWNGYQPDSYVPAFQRVTDRLRASGNRFAIVWCTHPIDPLSTMLRYYPGDEYVDWWAIDLFQTRFMLNQATRDFLAEAIVHERPVMIGEATPTETGVGDGDRSWDRWYAPFFEIIRENAGIKAFCSINRDWCYISSLPSWGNANIQTDTTVLRRYRQELASELYLNLPQQRDHLTAIVFAEEELELSTAATDSDPLRTAIGTDGRDTFATFYRFDLDTLAEDDILAVNLWVAGRNGSDEDRTIEVLEVEDWLDDVPTFSRQPRVVRSLGVVGINDNRRDKLVFADVTPAVRAAMAEGRSAIAFTFGPAPGSDPLNTFHSARRQDGYPPQLQVVYNESTTVSLPRSPDASPIGVRVQPNPVTTHFTVHSAEQGLTIDVFDATGRRIHHQENLPGPQTIDTDSWVPGTYFLRVSNAAGSRGQTKIVKVR